MTTTEIFTHRLATMDDAAAIAALMERAIAQLQAPFLSPEQIAASRAVMGLDTQLIADGTYFMIFDGEELVGCGGWSPRATPYGGDASAGRDTRLLDPAKEPARVRAMYTDPAHVRRGIGRLILTLCEGAARAAGFTEVELTATLAGEPLYRAAGFVADRHFTDKNVPLIRMVKKLG